MVAEPGKPAKLDAAEERPDVQHVALTNVDDSLILFYSRAKVTSPAVKEALEQVIAKKRAIEAIGRARQEKEREIQVVEQEICSAPERGWFRTAIFSTPGRPLPLQPAA